MRRPGLFGSCARRACAVPTGWICAVRSPTCSHESTITPQKSPNIDEISDTLAWIYLKKNLTEEAIEILAKLVNKRPDQPTFHYHLGAAWLKKGSIIKAREELQTALSHRPSPDEIGKIKELL